VCALIRENHAGDTVIVRFDDKWFWLIPLSDTKVSVGVVMDQEAFAKARQSPADLFESIWKSSSEMRSRMKNPGLLAIFKPRATSLIAIAVSLDLVSFSVGDAAGVYGSDFSAGVFLAMYSGRLAAQVVEKALVRRQRWWKGVEENTKTRA